MFGAWCREEFAEHQDCKGDIQLCSLHEPIQTANDRLVLLLPVFIKGFASIIESVTLGCFTNGTITQVVTNSLSPLSGEHLYDVSRTTL